MNNHTIFLEAQPGIIGTGSLVGKKEGDGPLSDKFDMIFEDARYSEKTWEKAESRIQYDAYQTAIRKSNLSESDINCIFSGDLLNQCTASTFAYRDSNTPYIGLYGACSTFVEGLLLGSLMVNAGYADYIAACVSSHFCTAERQFRTPLEYGVQRTPTAQWTVTGAGCAIVGKKREGLPRITAVTIGTITDGGIADANNMGVAMAPAAFESIYAHLNSSGTGPDDFDLIATGDLGFVGKQLLGDLFEMEGIDIRNKLFDCGCEIFNREEQDVHAGGSGAACSATVFCGHITEEMKKQNLKRVLFCGTGALQSVLSVQQKESIPAVCHIIELES